MKLTTISTIAAASFFATVAVAQDNSDQPAIDACIDALMASGMAGAQGGTVLNSSFSEAGTEVIFEDGGGVAWRCIAYKDGSVGLLEEATAEQTEAARSAPDISDWQEQVGFDPGTSGTTLTRTMEAGGAFEFLLRAREGQFLRVSVTPQEGEMYYTIRYPDGSLLLEGTDASEEYNGQLPQSGDYMVEVVSKESVDVTYEISFEIE
jgi:hypothetical protein